MKEIAGWSENKFDELFGNHLLMNSEDRRELLAHAQRTEGINFTGNAEQAIFSKGSVGSRNQLPPFNAGEIVIKSADFCGSERSLPVSVHQQIISLETIPPLANSSCVKGYQFEYGHGCCTQEMSIRGIPEWVDANIFSVDVLWRVLEDGTEAIQAEANLRAEGAIRRLNIDKPLSLIFTRKGVKARLATRGFRKVSARELQMINLEGGISTSSEGVVFSLSTGALDIRFRLGPLQSDYPYFLLAGDLVTDSQVSIVPAIHWRLD